MFRCAERVPVLRVRPNALESDKVLEFLTYRESVSGEQILHLVKANFCPRDGQKAECDFKTNTYRDQFSGNAVNLHLALSR